MYAVMITLGEMISLLPVPGGFLALANRCLTPALVSTVKVILTSRDLRVGGRTGFH